MTTNRNVTSMVVGRSFLLWAPEPTVVYLHNKAKNENITNAV